MHPRIVAERCLQHNAAALILAHNHPSGSLHASNADIDLTRLIAKAVGLFDIELLDHIIIAGEKCLSMAEQGLMD